MNNSALQVAAANIGGLCNQTVDKEYASAAQEFMEKPTINNIIKIDGRCFDCLYEDEYDIVDYCYKHGQTHGIGCLVTSIEERERMMYMNLAHVRVSGLQRGAGSPIPFVYTPFQAIPQTWQPRPRRASCPLELEQAKSQAMDHALIQAMIREEQEMLKAVSMSAKSIPRDECVCEKCTRVVTVIFWIRGVNWETLEVRMACARM